MMIRDEEEADIHLVQEIHLAAFPDDGESKLVNRLREKAKPLVSLVADIEGKPVGHILFTPVTLNSDASLKLMGLAPMAVLPQFQRQGIGAELVAAGLKKCRHYQCGAVAVLGHSQYYPKFGFLNASRYSIKSEYDVPADAFMIIELEDDYLRHSSGTISYHEEFNKL